MDKKTKLFGRISQKDSAPSDKNSVQKTNTESSALRVEDYVREKLSASDTDKQPDPSEQDIEKIKKQFHKKKKAGSCAI